LCHLSWKSCFKKPCVLWVKQVRIDETDLWEDNRTTNNFSELIHYGEFESYACVFLHHLFTSSTWFSTNDVYKLVVRDKWSSAFVYTNLLSLRRFLTQESVEQLLSKVKSFLIWIVTLFTIPGIQVCCLVTHEFSTGSNPHWLINIENSTNPTCNL